MDRPDFPTMEQVEKATHEQLARWYRFFFRVKNYPDIKNVYRPIVLVHQAGEQADAQIEQGTYELLRAVAQWISGLVFSISDFRGYLEQLKILKQSNLVHKVLFKGLVTSKALSLSH